MVDDERDYEKEKKKDDDDDDDDGGNDKDVDEANDDNVFYLRMHKLSKIEHVL